MPEHKVPALTVRLGSILDCTLQYGKKRFFVDEWKGMHLLTDADCFDRDPGKARLFFVRGKLGNVDVPDTSSLDEAIEAYGRWHQRAAGKLGELDTRPCAHMQGRLLRIGYRSDKWHPRGENEDYDHDFLEHWGRPPLVYTDTKDMDRAHNVVVVGGDFVVSEQGIA